MTSPALSFGELLRDSLDPDGDCGGAPEAIGGMNWQSIGHVDFMLRTLDLGVGLGLQRALLNRATITMTAVNDSADTANDATCAALSAFLASGSQSELLRIQACLAGDADLLVVEDPPKRGGSGSGRFAKLLKSYAATLPVMREKRDEVDVDGRGGGLTKRCGKVRQWRRFCAGARGGTPWPRCRTRVQAESDVGDDADDRFVSSSGYGVVVVRLQGGGNQEALRMTTAAVASVMPPGATLVVCGTRAEGVLGSATASTIESYFHGCRVASATRDLDGGGVVLLASRRCGLVMSSAGNGASGSLDTWARDQTLELPGTGRRRRLAIPYTDHDAAVASVPRALCRRRPRRDDNHAASDVAAHEPCQLSSGRRRLWWMGPQGKLHKSLGGRVRATDAGIRRDLTSPRFDQRNINSDQQINPTTPRHDAPSHA